MITDVINNSTLVDKLVELGKILPMVNNEPLKALEAIRTIENENTLTGYENMLETHSIETRANIRNFVLSLMETTIKGIKENIFIDKNMFKDYIKSNLKIENFNIESLDVLLSKISDPEAYDLVQHKLAISDKLSSLNNGMFTLSKFEKDVYGENMFMSIVERYNTLLEYIVPDSDVNHDETLISVLKFTRPDLEPDLDITKLENFKTVANDIYTILNMQIDDVKNLIPDVDFKLQKFNAICNKLMSIYNDFASGKINEETYNYLLDIQTENMRFFIKIIFSYYQSIVNYIEFLESYVDAFNNVIDSSLVITALFKRG